MSMRLPKSWEKYRWAGEPDCGADGAFLVPWPRGMTLALVVNDGRDWQQCGLPGEAWEHASLQVFNAHRLPSWDEMEFVKRALWNESDWVMQLHAPPTDHINLHPKVLHLWRPTVTPVPTPPKSCV